MALYQGLDPRVPVPRMRDDPPAKAHPRPEGRGYPVLRTTPRSCIFNPGTTCASSTALHRKLAEHERQRFLFAVQRALQLRVLDRRQNLPKLRARRVAQSN